MKKEKVQQQMVIESRWIFLTSFMTEDVHQVQQGTKEGQSLKLPVWQRSLTACKEPPGPAGTPRGSWGRISNPKIK